MLTRRIDLRSVISCSGFDGRLLGIALLCGVLGFGGCSSRLSGAAISSVTVTVSGAGQVRLGSTAQLTAVVADSTAVPGVSIGQAVSWQVNGIAGGSSTVGTISASGLYTPPAAIPTPNTVTITAVSVASPTASGAASEAVLNPAPSVSSAAITENAGAATGLLDVIGTGFVAGSQLQAAGATVATTFVSATELRAGISMAPGVTAVAVDVVNPNPGGMASATANAQVTGLLASLAAAARLLDQATFGRRCPPSSTLRRWGCRLI